MNFDRIMAHSTDALGNGTAPEQINKLEKIWGISLPQEFKQFLLTIGYAEIYEDEIYSIYSVPDQIACKGLHWMNKDNKYLQNGFIEFFSNDIDGAFYIHHETGIVYLHSPEHKFSDSFIQFIDKLLGA